MLCQNGTRFAKDRGGGGEICVHGDVARVSGVLQWPKNKTNDETLRHERRLAKIFVKTCVS
jgi:hypothetical protein